MRAGTAQFRGELSRRGSATFLKRLAVAVGPALLAAGVAVVGVVGDAQARVPAGNLTVKVEGRLGGVVSTPLSLSPAFSPRITDYVLRCQAGTNLVQMTFSGAAYGPINVRGRQGASVAIQVSLIENEALIVDTHGPGNPGGTQYWIRCLPHDFPQLNVTKPGNPPPGWYLTGNLHSFAGSAAYAMVLDANGTPVWYRRSSGSSAVDVTWLGNGSIAWGPALPDGFGVDPNGAFEDHSVASSATRWIMAPVAPMDFHEIQPMSNGDLMVLSSPLRAGVDLSPIGFAPNATIVDCVLQEMDPAGRLVWQWRASDHIDVGESTTAFPAIVRRQLAYDPLHCNSIDIDPVSGDMLLSTRNTDAIYLIDKVSSRLVWKLGGKAFNHDHAQILTITGDPEGAFHNQHDARFQPNGDVSLFDNQSSRSSLAARGVEYHIDTLAGTGTLVWSYESADRHNSAATGSFRRLNQGTDNVIAWGVKPHTLFTEVDSDGNVMLNVTFPNGEAAYRVQKLPLSALSHQSLRVGAGLPAAVRPFVPSVGFVGPNSGPGAGGTSVNVVGSGFTGASRVSFGSNDATAFIVVNDGLIIATAPAGSGVSTVTVTGPFGTSSVAPSNQLLTAVSDSSFEGGTGSWIAGANSSLALASTYTKSGTFSLRVSPLVPGAISAQTGLYLVPSSSQVTGAAWVLTLSGSDQVQAITRFYSADGTLLASYTGSVVTSSSTGWVSVSVVSIAPAGAASVAIGVSDTSPSGLVYVDDTALMGSPQYVYTP